MAYTHVTPKQLQAILEAQEADTSIDEGLLDLFKDGPYSPYDGVGKKIAELIAKGKSAEVLPMLTRHAEKAEKDPLWLNKAFRRIVAGAKSMVKDGRPTPELVAQCTKMMDDLDKAA